MAVTITDPAGGTGQEVSDVDVVPDTVALPVPGRPRVLLVGTGLAAAGLIVFFAALLGLYLSARAGVLADGGTWFPEGSEISLTPGTAALFTFALSLVTMQWAVYSVSNNDRSNAIFALLMTILFGGAVINATAFLYTSIGLSVRGPGPAGLMFFTLTGAHLAMVAGALVFAALMTFRTLGGEYAGRDRDGIVAASLIWYLVAAMYVVIWYAVYVTK